MDLPDYLAAPEIRSARVRGLAALIVVLLLAGVVAAATTSTHDSGRPATTGEIALLSSAAASAEVVPSAAFRMRLEMSIQGQKMRTEMNGVVDNERGVGQFTVRMPVQLERMGVPLELEMVVTETTTFLQVPEDLRPATGGKLWASAPVPRSAALEATSASPQSTLELLSRDRISGSQVTRHDDREIGGVNTQQYRVVLDLAAVAEHHPGQAVAGMQPPPSGEMPLTVFIGDDGIVRRMDIRLSLPGGSMKTTFEMFDVEAPVHVEVPSLDASHPVPDLMALLGLIGLSAPAPAGLPAASG